MRLAGLTLGLAAIAGCSRPEPVVEISAGFTHTCARRASGSLVCWGDNFSGQLGDGTFGGYRIAPTEVVRMDDAIEIAASSQFTCALRASGAVACWGSNGGGSLGVSPADALVPGPAPVFGLNDAVEVAAGGAHVCARRSSGSVVCWGNNVFGQTGDGTEVYYRFTPVAVGGVSDAIEIAAGSSHSCARLSTGAVVCWGVNIEGEIGDGTSSRDRLTPVPVTGLNDAVEITAGDEHSCARRASGAVVCWGFNGEGQIGDGTTGINRLTPVGVIGLSDAVEIAAGSNHTCARRASGTVVCWGHNDRGQIGDGFHGRDRPTPVAVSGLDDVVEISAGDSHTCARRTAGAIVCWGSNQYAQIGAAPFDVDRLTPVPVPIP